MDQLHKRFTDDQIRFLYRRISVFNKSIEVPNVPLREDVDVHLVPDEFRKLMHIRIWWQDNMVHSVSLPLRGFKVHF